MGEVVAGLDIGTSSTKLVLFGDRVVYTDRFDYTRGISNGKEIDPELLVKKIILLVRKAGKTGLKIRAIGLSSLFPSFIAIDRRGKPLTRIITWMDSRGDALASRFRKKKKEAGELQERTGCPIHESYTIWKILWLKENDPETFSRAGRFLTLPDYMAYRFTGKFSISYASASTTGLFNTSSREWDGKALELAGISESRLSECKSIFHSERLLKQIGRKMGLDGKAVFVLGAGDGHLSSIGSGCLKSKMFCSTIGTSSAIRLLGAKRANNSSVWRYFLFDDKYISGVATNSGFSTLDWFYRNILKKSPEKAVEDIEKLDLAKQNDLTFLPFQNGERGPGYNQGMEASLIGANPDTTKEDIHRAIIDGIMFNLYDCYRLLPKRKNEIVATGGYTNSKNLLQMQADVFNARVHVPSVTEASAVGAAAVSLVAIRRMRSLSEIEVPPEKTYLPDPKRHREYMKRYKNYREQYLLATGLKKRDRDG